MRILLMVTVIATATFLDVAASRAYDGPWCAQYALGLGGVVENCSMRSFAMMPPGNHRRQSRILLSEPALARQFPHRRGAAQGLSQALGQLRPASSAIAARSAEITRCVPRPPSA